MKNIIMSLLAAVGLFVTGCTNTPSEATVSATAYACGMVAGYTTELSKTKTEVKEAIITVLDIAGEVIPATNETFTVAWSPIIENEVEKLVTDGKIDATQAAIVKTAATTVTSGIDYLFSRHADWKNYQNLVSAAASGFISGYKAVVSGTLSAGQTPADGVIAEDVEAYKALLSQTK